MSLGPLPGGNKSALNVSTATVIKASPGVLVKVVVVTAPSAAGGIYDSAATTGLGASNLIDSIGQGLAVSYVFDLNWPCQNGITINPGTGGVMSISYI